MEFTNKDAYNFLTELSHFLIKEEANFNELDNVTGDGDHGASLSRGAKAVLEKLPSYKDETIDVIFREYAKLVISSIGGAIGPIYGMFFLQFSRQLKKNNATQLTGFLFAHSLLSSLAKIQDLGNAKVGDKTLIDALKPATDKAMLNSNTLLDAVNAAYEGADEGRISTINMMARKGRSKYVKEQAIGHADAGATSLTQIFAFWKAFLENK